MFKAHVWIVLFSICCHPCSAEKSDWDESDQPYKPYVSAPDSVQPEPIANQDDQPTRIPRDQILGAPVQPEPPENAPPYAEPEPSLAPDKNLIGSSPPPSPVKKGNFFFNPSPVPWLDKSVDAVTNGIASGAKGTVRAAKSTGRVIKENKAAIAKGVLITGVAAGAVTGGYFLLRNANKQSGKVSPDYEWVQGFTDSEGVYHPPYRRTVSDSNPWNNYSTYGNQNPWTSQWGTVKPPGWP